MRLEVAKRLEFAKKTAIRAGDIILEGFGGRIEGRMKSSREVVTETDLRSEEFILKAIRENFDEPALSEEFNPEAFADGPLWVIDPLDGTNNFASGIPFFAVIIAFALDCETRLGVIYEPIRKELFWSDGRNSFLGNDRIEVSKTAKLSDCMAATGFPYKRGEGCNSNLENFVRVAMSIRGIRRAGSAGLDLAYTAAGRFDFYWELGLRPWDMAAGELIVRCAGGKTADLDGNKWSLGSDNILAGNPTAFDKAASLLSRG